MQTTLHQYVSQPIQHVAPINNIMIAANKSVVKSNGNFHPIPLARPLFFGISKNTRIPGSVPCSTRKLLSEWGSDAAEKCSVDMAGETDELGLPEIRVTVYFAVRRPVEKEESVAPDDSAAEEEKTAPKAKRARVTKK